MSNATHAIMFSLGSKATRTAAQTQQIQDSHNQYMLDLKLAGKVVLSGPWRDQPGYMAIVSVEGDDAATDIARNDPAVRAGVLKFEVKAWLAQ